MGHKANIKAMQAARRARERDAQKRMRELQRRAKESAKLREQQQAELEVALYENQMEVISSIHKEASDEWDWQGIAESDEPTAPVNDGENEREAQARLDGYTPGALSRLLGGARKNRERMEQEVRAARELDAQTYSNAMKLHEEELQELHKYKEIARGIVTGDLVAYNRAIQETNPFEDINGVGSSLEFRIVAPWYVEATLHVNSNDVIPPQVKTLSKSGKVLTKDVPVGRRNEVYQDYVSGSVLRVARELFALLPIELVIVHAVGELLDSMSGHFVKQPILSVAIPRDTLSRLNFDTIDCSDALKNFVHAMKFNKATGFAPIEPIDATTFSPTSTEPLLRRPKRSSGDETSQPARSITSVKSLHGQPAPSTTVPRAGAAAPSRNAMQILFMIAAWIWGVVCIAGGAMNIGKHPLYAVLMMVLGVFVLPPIWRGLMEAMGNPPSLRYTLIPGLIALVPMMVMSRQDEALRKAEEARQAAIAAEALRQDSLFLAEHPAVEPAAYAEWKGRAKDSVKNPSLGLGSFLMAQDSVEKQRVQDSILAEKTRKQDSIRDARAAYQAKIEADRAEKRAAAAERERNRPETYNGHEVFTGPRGGRYYINSNGNKTYIR